MKNRTIATIGIIAAVLMTVSGAELAFAKGGKGGGTSNGQGAGASMAKSGNTYQYKHKQQNQYQHRQENAMDNAQAENAMMQGDQVQSRNRLQIEDPATHQTTVTE